MKVTQNRLRSKVAWGTVVALLLLAGSTFKLWDAIGITDVAAQGLLNGLMAVAAAFGIFNDPTNAGGF
jgi:uncharacterized membrane protein